MDDVLDLGWRGCCQLYLFGRGFLESINLRVGREQGRRMKLTFYDIMVDLIDWCHDCSGYLCLDVIYLR